MAVGVTAACLFIKGSVGQCPSEKNVLRDDLLNANRIKWKSGE